MNNEVAIAINNVGKNFKVPHEKHDTLKGKALNLFSSKKYSKYTALQNINFEVKKGEFFGIVGKNGCGKSTLLKIIAGIYQPTKGNVEVNGSIAPFIELGVGFNPELTGRENVFLSGTILGMTRKKIESLYNEIVAFAEMEEFMDQKLKNYSSGMQVRLAFSIAVRAESDILLIDEVLAVGDAAFQAKCFDYFNQLKSSGKTIIFVTHDMANVRRFCDQAVLISESKIMDIGHPNKIANQYDKLNQKTVDKETIKLNKNSNDQHIVKVETYNTNMKKQLTFSEGEDAIIEFSWPKDVKVQNLGVAIVKNSGEYLYGKNTLKQKNLKLTDKNSQQAKVKLNISPGKYYLMYSSLGKDRNDVIEFVEKGPIFNVLSSEDDDWEGLTHLSGEWL